MSRCDPFEEVSKFAHHMITNGLQTAVILSPTKRKANRMRSILIQILRQQEYPHGEITIRVPSRDHNGPKPSMTIINHPENA